MATPRLEVVVEEIAVQRRLSHTRDPHNPLTVARFSEEAVDPVEDVEATVHAEEEDIVTGHVVDVARPLQEDQLRQDGHSLEVDGEGPQQLHDGELVVDEEREDGARHDEEEDAKGVLLTVIRRPHHLVVPHVVHNGARGTKENQLHDRVVQGNVAREEVQVAADKHKRIQLLCLEGDTPAGPLALDLEQQQNDGQQMGHVPSKTEDIHLG
mmetsp:Transcript_26757/g.47647  ORF Transcript_26757/g.47647 Transcript_26757/m.47647 type:complete len:211 (+) Transcript_26757:238-870(+)